MTYVAALNTEQRTQFYSKVELMPSVGAVAQINQLPRGAERQLHLGQFAACRIERHGATQYEWTKRILCKSPQQLPHVHSARFLPSVVVFSVASGSKSGKKLYVFAA